MAGQALDRVVVSSGSAFRREVAAEGALPAWSPSTTLDAAVAYVIARDEDVARDAVQAAWAIAWRRLTPSGSGPHRRLAGHDRGQSDPIGPPPASAACEAQVATPPEITTDDQPAGQDALVDLSLRWEPGARGSSPLALRYVAGLESAEIGSASRISASGVRSRLGRLPRRAPPRGARTWLTGIGSTRRSTVLSAVWPRVRPSPSNSSASHAWHRSLPGCRRWGPPTGSSAVRTLAVAAIIAACSASRRSRRAGIHHRLALPNDGTPLSSPAGGTRRLGSWTGACWSSGIGLGGQTTLASAELYDPSTGRFVRTGPCTLRARGTSPRSSPMGGCVAGGVGRLGHRRAAGNLATAEIYDPASGTFSDGSSPRSAARPLSVGGQGPAPGRGRGSCRRLDLVAGGGVDGRSLDLVDRSGRTARRGELRMEPARPDGIGLTSGCSHPRTATLVPDGRVFFTCLGSYHGLGPGARRG